MIDKGFLKKLNYTFLTITLIALVSWGYIIYQNRQFDANPLSEQILEKLEAKERHIQKLILQKFGLTVKIPIHISSKMQSNLYGIAAFNGGDIVIVLNKKRFKESEEYMIDYVLPHEYAHALMFVFGDFSMENGGHTKKWQKVCLELEGKKCDRFVDHQDVIMGKIDLFARYN